MGFFVPIGEHKTTIEMENLFKYIEVNLKENNTVDFHTWGDTKRAELYPVAKKLFDKVKDSPVVSYNNKVYFISFSSATNGMGGMSMGTPDTITFRLIENPVEIKDVKPEPVEKPDWSSVIANACDVIETIYREGRHVDEDEKQFIYEAVMETVYGKDIFEWINKNAY